MTFGRKDGFLVMFGVVCGAVTWGTLASVGISAFLAAKPNAVGFIKVFGCVYLFYLAFKALKRVINPLKSNDLTKQSVNRISFLKGYLMHMSNPEAMLGWIALVTLGLKPDSPDLAPLYIVIGCVVIGIIVYGANAYLFSAKLIHDAYFKYSRFVEGVFAIVFASAAMMLFISIA